MVRPARAWVAAQAAARQQAGKPDAAVHEWKAAEDARQAAIDAEADRLGTQGLLRLLRELEALQQRHHGALLHLAEGRSHAAWRVLTGREEP